MSFKGVGNVLLAEVGKRAQLLRALAALAEDLGSVFSIHVGSQPPVIPVSEDPMSSTGFCRHSMPKDAGKTPIHQTILCVQWKMVKQ